jgi:ubiquinol-cytochrome c reductase cytochrome b subunit
VVVIAFLPWLDRSPVKSIRYRGPIYKRFLTLFVIAFLTLGYLGTQPPSPMGQIISQICSVIYFGFFLLMPWYSKIDKCKPEPERVIFK